MIVELIDKWNEISNMLLEHGYGLRQVQYDIYSPEGFHALFGAAEYPIVEIVTHSNEVHDAIVRYGL